MRRGWCERVIDALCPFFRNRNDNAGDNNLESLRRRRSSVSNSHGLSLNIILYGECGVGKTSLRNRWVDGIFTGDVAPTFGVDFNIKTLAFVEGGDEQRSRDDGGEQNCSPAQRASADEEDGKMQRHEDLELRTGSGKHEGTTQGLIDSGSSTKEEHDKREATTEYGDNGEGSAREHGSKGRGSSGGKRASSTHVEVKVNVYDTSGKAGYREVNNTYLLAFDAVLFVYDISSVASLNELRRFFADTEHRNRLMARKRAGAVMLLVGNKGDLPVSDRQVGIQTGQDASAEFGIPFMEVSAKQGTNVKNAFMSVATRVVEKRLVREALILGRGRNSGTRGVRKLAGLQGVLRASASVMDILNGMRGRKGSKARHAQTQLTPPKLERMRRPVSSRPHRERRSLQQATTSVSTAPLLNEHAETRPERKRTTKPQELAIRSARTGESDGNQPLETPSSARERAFIPIRGDTRTEIPALRERRSPSNRSRSRRAMPKRSTESERRGVEETTVGGMGEGPRAALLQRETTPSPISGSCDSPRSESDGDNLRRSPFVRSSRTRERSSSTGRPQSLRRRRSPSWSSTSPNSTKPASPVEILEKKSFETTAAWFSDNEDTGDDEDGGNTDDHDSDNNRNNDNNRSHANIKTCRRRPVSLGFPTVSRSLGTDGGINDGQHSPGLIPSFLSIPSPHYPTVLNDIGWQSPQKEPLPHQPTAHELVAGNVRGAAAIVASAAAGGRLTTGTRFARHGCSARQQRPSSLGYHGKSRVRRGISNDNARNRRDAGMANSGAPPGVVDDDTPRRPSSYSPPATGSLATSPIAISNLIPSSFSQELNRAHGSPSLCLSPRAMLNPEDVSVSARIRDSDDGKPKYEGQAGERQSGFASQDKHHEPRWGRMHQKGTNAEGGQSETGARASRWSGPASGSKTGRKQPPVGVGMAALSLVLTPSSSVSGVSGTTSRGYSDGSRCYQREAFSLSTEGQTESSSQPTESAALFLKQASSFWLDKWGIKAAKTDASRGRHARARRAPSPSPQAYTIPKFSTEAFSPGK